MREEEKKRSSQGFKRFFKKRWVVPAIYIASAAIILTGVLWYQSSGNSADKYNYKTTENAKKKFNEPSLVVNKSMENFVMPVKNKEEAVIQKRFYDNNAKAEDQEAALVQYKDTYVPNTGLNIAMKDGSEFEVVAALSGTVTKVEEDSLLGNVVEIQHDTGIVTQYQSVKDVKVAVGDQVDKGDVIAKAGQSKLNEKAGVHVHFEIRKDGVAVNPNDYFDKPLSVLQQAKFEDEAEKSNAPADEESAGESEDGERAPSDGSSDKKEDNSNS